MPMRRISMYVALFLITVMLTLTACSSSNSPAAAPITVTVSDQLNHAYPGVTVVLGDGSGAMKKYGTTDSNGQITFAAPPANATVTVAASCPSSGATTTTYSLDVRYDVNGPVAFRLDSCPDYVFFGTPAGPSALGTITVNVTNALSNVVYNEILNKPRLDGYRSLITTQTVTIEPYDLQKDGKLSLIVIGKDAFNNPVGYGELLDQTFTDGMTVDITVDQPMSFIQYQLTNIPATANFICSGVLQTRTDKEKAYSVSVCNGLSPDPSSTSIDVPYIPGLGDSFGYSINLEVTSPWAESRSVQYLSYRGGAAPENQSFDFNTALSAPSNLTVTGANTPTPTFSWTGVDPGATRFHVWANMNLPSSTYLYFSLDDLSLSRTSITFPELPDSLAAFRPVGLDAFGINTDAAEGNITKSSAGWYMPATVSANAGFVRQAAGGSRYLNQWPSFAGSTLLAKPVNPASK